MSERMEFRDWSTDAVEKLRAQEVEIKRLQAEVLKLTADLAFCDGYRQAIEEARQRGRR